VAVDKRSGNILVNDRIRLVLYNSAGTTILKRLNLSFLAYNLDFGPTGNIFVVNRNENTVYVYDSNLTYIGKYRGTVPDAWRVGIGADTVVWVTQFRLTNKVMKITCMQGI
jgi:hypothetical protein